MTLCKKTLSENEIDKLHFELFILERHRVISNELKFISHHHRIVESTLITEVESVNAALWKEVDAAVDQEDELDILESFGNACYEREHTYPNMHRSAMLITLYSFIEVSLSRYCEFFQKNLSVKAQNFKSGSINGYRDWLENKVGVRFAFAETYWDEIDCFRMLRNSVVHAYGDIGTNPKLESYIDLSPHISFSEIGLGYCQVMGNGFELEASFIEHVVQTVSKFFENLTDGMRHLFLLSEDEINAELHLHYEIEEQKRIAEFKALGNNPSMSDIVRLLS